MTDCVPVAVAREIPALVGAAWPIGPKPDLSVLGLEPLPGALRRNEPNDHCLFQSADGAWHLWACVRCTGVGRILCHWEAGSLRESPWRLVDEVIRADRDAGESLCDWHGEEFIQSPFVVRKGSRWYMFYGGYDTGLDVAGRPTDDYNLLDKQMCLMTSLDGRTWTRRRDAAGHSRVFAGPGAVRDQYVVKFDGLWHMYYSGHHDGDRNRAGIYLRTSPDLIHWSDWRLVHYESTPSNESPIIPESPVVVRRGEWYYLLRSSRHPVNVLRSRDPANFGIGDCRPYYVASLAVTAPEIVCDVDGCEYISSIYDGHDYGIRLCRLAWQEECSHD